MPSRTTQQGSELLHRAARRRSPRCPANRRTAHRTARIRAAKSLQSIPLATGIDHYATWTSAVSALTETAENHKNA